MGTVTSLKVTPVQKVTTIWVVDIEGINQNRYTYFTPSVFLYDPKKSLSVELLKKIEGQLERIAKKRNQIKSGDQQALEILNSIHQILLTGELRMPKYPDKHAVLTLLPKSVGLVSVQIGTMYT